jgi:hypothetical protein
MRGSESILSKHTLSRGGHANAAGPVAAINPHSVALTVADFVGANVPIACDPRQTKWNTDAKPPR